MASHQATTSSANQAEEFIMIRLATPDDLDDMLLLLQQLFGIEEDFTFDPVQQRKGLELLLDSAKAVIMVAENQDSVIAMGTAQLVISTSEGGLSLLVEDLVVKPLWQKLGIGSKLLRSLGDWGAARGARRIQLLADKTNSPAIGFYHRTGWRQTQLICLRKFHSKCEVKV
jgi:ribosomal protein S18 acetylase RimI-like enzyme